MVNGYDHITADAISSALSSVQTWSTIIPYPLSIFSKPPERAAVLLPLFRSKGSWNLLYIVRTLGTDPHSGQVAFPGGRINQDDPDPITTALRETQEEVGIISKDIHVLGILNDYRTSSNYIITPIVGVFTWPYNISLEEKEVQKTFSIPLKWLGDPENIERRQVLLRNSCEMIFVPYFKLYASEQVWGVTARITIDFLNFLDSIA